MSDLRRRTDRLLTDEVASELRLLRDAADHALRDHGLGQSGSEEASVRARTCFSTLSGYSALVKSVSTRAYAGMRHSLHLTATLKEMYAQQRGFLVGVGALPANALGALPPRALIGTLQLWEELQRTHFELAEEAKRAHPPLRAQLEAAIAVDDEKMKELSVWLRSDDFDLAKLRIRLEPSGPIPSEACWLAWTAHIDKLQAVEHSLLREHYESVAARAQLRSVAAHTIVVGGALLLPLLTLVTVFLNYTPSEPRLEGDGVQTDTKGVTDVFFGAVPTVLIGALGTVAAIIVAYRLGAEAGAKTKGKRPQMQAQQRKQRLSIEYDDDDPVLRGSPSAQNEGFDESSCSPSGTSPSSGTPITGSPAASIDASDLIPHMLIPVQPIAKAMERSMSWVWGGGAAASPVSSAGTSPSSRKPGKSKKSPRLEPKQGGSSGEGPSACSLTPPSVEDPTQESLPPRVASFDGSFKHKGEPTRRRHVSWDGSIGSIGSKGDVKLPSAAFKGFAVHPPGTSVAGAPAPATTAPLCDPAPAAVRAAAAGVGNGRGKNILKNVDSSSDVCSSPNTGSYQTSPATAPSKPQPILGFKPAGRPPANGAPGRQSREEDMFKLSVDQIVDDPFGVHAALDVPFAGKLSPEGSRSEGPASAVERQIELDLARQAAAARPPIDPNAIPLAGQMLAGQRVPAKMGLVAHKPMSAILARSEAESIAAVLDPNSTAFLTNKDGDELAETPEEQRRHPSKTDKKGDDSLSASGSPFELQKPPAPSLQRPPPPLSPLNKATSATPSSPASVSSSTSPRAARFDPSVDVLLDLFDDPNCLDKFKEVSCLGRGAFGQAVLLKKNDGLQLVAKKLHLDGRSQADLQRLETEVAVCARMRHPNICHYLGTVARDNMLLICLEYAAGGTLADRIDAAYDAKTPFHVELATTWIAQIATAVSYMHSMQVLHRDLSAQNVFLSRAEDIKVGDFGLSKASNTSQLSVRGRTLCGTPNYFSPEMVHGEPYGAASDAWSVGLLAHEILTLKHPFCGGSLAVMLQNIVAGKYDRRPLAEAPYPQELKNVATGEELLCADPKKRLTLEALLARPTFKLIED